MDKFNELFEAVTKKYNKTIKKDYMSSTMG